MENSKVVLTVDKKLVTTKRGSCDQFFAKIKFSEPGEAKYVHRVLILVAGPLMFQVLDISIDMNSMNMIRNKAENQHTQTQLKWRSLCAPLDIVPLLPVSSLFLGGRCFFGFFDFFFLFFWYFSSLRSIKEVTTENIRLNKWKAWPVENSEGVLKIDKSLWPRKEDLVTSFWPK